MHTVSPKREKVAVIAATTAKGPKTVKRGGKHKSRKDYDRRTSKRVSHE